MSTGVIVFLVLPLIFYPLFRAVYNITLHPLAKHPGPKLWAAFQFPYVYYVFRGTLPKRVRQLHDQYGSIVRIAPNELSFVSAQAWKDIYSGKGPQNPKDMNTYLPPDEYEGKRMIMETNDAKHHAMRSQISHAFSTKAMLEHQPLISGYVDQLISSIRVRVPERKALDIAAWFNWTTFDIAGALTFGESFHCLDTASYHPWIKVIFDGITAGTLLNQLNRYGLLNIAMSLIPKSVQKPRDDMCAYSNTRMDARIKMGFGPGTRRDWAYYMRNPPDGKSFSESAITFQVMSREVMCANGESLVIAGSETTATLLSGFAFFLLTKRPDYLEKVKAEVRTAFTNDSLDEMNFKTVTENLPLMIAGLRETLRLYPPLPFGLARKVINEPRMIDGHLIPVGTSLSISQWAANHAEMSWHRPDDFLPERWLEDATQPGSLYEHDQRDACQPFSYGPRNCLGRTLAEVESRLVFAKMLFNFDFDLVKGQLDWQDKQRVGIIWGKGPLMLNFTDIRA